MLDYTDFHLTYWLDAIALEYRRRGFAVRFQPFIYAADFRPLTANATQAVPVAIDRDADFIWCENTYSAFSLAGVSQLTPDILVQHTAVSSQRDLESGQVHLMNVYGTGERPFILAKPLIVAAKSAVSVTLQSLLGVDLNVSLSWIGVKAFLSRMR